MEWLVTDQGRCIPLDSPEAQRDRARHLLDESLALKAHAIDAAKRAHETVRLAILLRHQARALRQWPPHCSTPQ